MENLLMGAPVPDAGPPAAPPQRPQIDPEQIAAARAHMGVVMEGLLGLAAKPEGSLSKRDLFNAAGEMIAQGAFSTPEAKQQLVAQLAQIPDDEASIRKAIGGQLMQLGETAARMAELFPMEPPNG